MTEAKPAPKGVVTLETLRGKRPDSVRIHPYNPSKHAASRYEMEPDLRPPDYKLSSDGQFNIARRKVYALVLGVVVGGVIIGAFVAIVVAISLKSRQP